MPINQKNKLILIGNDIISLNNAANLKSFANQRYIEKSFTEGELVFINENNYPDLPQLLWNR